MTLKYNVMDAAKLEQPREGEAGGTGANNGNGWLPRSHIKGGPLAEVADLVLGYIYGSNSIIYIRLRRRV